MAMRDTKRKPPTPFDIERSKLFEDNQITYSTYINSTNNVVSTSGYASTDIPFFQYIPKEKMFDIVSPGELFDKLSILEIKKNKGLEVNKEHNELFIFLKEYMPKISVIYDLLLSSNKSQWDLEDKIRTEENLEDVGRFAILIREFNDTRVGLKNKINYKLNLGYQERKDYKRR